MRRVMRHDFEPARTIRQKRVEAAEARHPRKTVLPAPETRRERTQRTLMAKRRDSGVSEG